MTVHRRPGWAPWASAAGGGAQAGIVVTAVVLDVVDPAGREVAVKESALAHAGESDNRTVAAAYNGP
jgi:hypothetical protein